MIVRPSLIGLSWYPGFSLQAYLTRLLILFLPFANASCRSWRTFPYRSPFFCHADGLGAGATLRLGL